MIPTIKPRRPFDREELAEHYDESDQDFVENNFEAAVLLLENSDLIAKALKDLLCTCNSRGRKLGLDEGGPVLDNARETLKLFGIRG